MTFILSLLSSLVARLLPSGTKPNPPTPAQVRAKELRNAEPWIMWVFAIGFIICGVASGYATFYGYVVQVFGSPRHIECLETKRFGYGHLLQFYRRLYQVV